MNDIPVRRIIIHPCDSPKTVTLHMKDKTHTYNVLGSGTYNVAIAHEDIVIKISRTPSVHIPDDVLRDYVYSNLMVSNTTGYPVNPFLGQTLITLGSTVALVSDKQQMPLNTYIKNTSPYIRALNTKIIIETLAHALYLLKSSRILHRDIKPGNILINTINNTITSVYLVDFGISTNIYRTEPLIECVTEWYRAPEITQGLDQPRQMYSYPSDTWAVGVTLYEYIHGAPMFKSTSNENLIELHKSPPEIPDSPYKHIIKQMVDMDPHKRITPDQLLIALDLPLLPVYPVGHDCIIKIRTRYSVEYKLFFNAAKILTIEPKSKLFNCAISVYSKLVAKEGHSYFNAITALLLAIKLVSFDNGLYVEYTQLMLIDLQLNASIEQLIENELRVIQLITPFIDLSVAGIGTASLSS